MKSLPLNPSNHPPFIKGSPLLGSLKELTRNPLGFLNKVADLNEPIVELRLGPKPSFVVGSPDLIKEIFLTGRNVFLRRDMFDKLRPVLGNGLLSIDGQKWRQKRRIMQNIFAGERLKSYELTMKRETIELISTWKTGTTQIDITETMMQLTLKIIFKCILGDKLPDNIPYSSFTDLNRITGKRLWHATALQQWLPTADNFNFFRHKKRVESFINHFLDQALKEHSLQDQGLLAALLAAKDPDSGEKLSRQDIYDQVVTFIFAGHETTAVALAWTIIELARHSDWSQKCIDEIQSTSSLSSAPQSRLIVDAVLKESMRLNPPVWIIPRTATHAYQLDNYHIPQGSIILTCPFTLHRNKNLWQDADTFSPQRFIDQPSPEKFAYIPFGVGPHTCIGMEFAILEARTILTTLLQHCRFKQITTDAVMREPDVTMRPKGKIVFAVSPAIKENDKGSDAA